MRFSPWDHNKDIIDKKMIENHIKELVAYLVTLYEPIMFYDGVFILQDA